MFYSDFPVVLEWYCDTNWITSSSDNKSTSWWIFSLGGGAISWAYKKQIFISFSTIKSKCIVMVAARKKSVMDFRNLLLDIKLWLQPMSTISLYCDNKVTMSWTYNNIYNSKSRHISIWYWYVQNLITNRAITIIYVNYVNNLANSLTKGLSRDMVRKTNGGMGWNILLKTLVMET